MGKLFIVNFTPGATLMFSSMAVDRAFLQCTAMRNYTVSFHCSFYGTASMHNVGECIEKRDGNVEQLHSVWTMVILNYCATVTLD